MKFQFRIADLLVCVALAAILAYNFRYDRDTLAVVCWAIFMASLGVASLAAWFRRGRSGRFGQGFALFGWPWLACGLRFGFLPTSSHSSS